MCCGIDIYHCTCIVFMSVVSARRWWSMCRPNCTKLGDSRSQPQYCRTNVIVFWASTFGSRRKNHYPWTHDTSLHHFSITHVFIRTVLLLSVYQNARDGECGAQSRRFIQTQNSDRDSQTNEGGWHWRYPSGQMCTVSSQARRSFVIYVYVSFVIHMLFIRSGMRSSNARLV